MKSFISILSFQTNSCSGENLAGGLLAVSGHKIWFKTSEFKLQIAKMICGQEYETTVKQITNLIQNQINSSQEESLTPFSSEYFSYLNKYSQGILQFSPPKPVGLPIDDSSFDELFKQFIGERVLTDAL
jgi:hypothetical protein